MEQTQKSNTRWAPWMLPLPFTGLQIRYNNFSLWSALVFSFTSQKSYRCFLTSSNYFSFVKIKGKSNPARDSLHCLFTFSPPKCFSPEMTKIKASPRQPPLGMDNTSDSVFLELLVMLALRVPWGSKGWLVLSRQPQRVGWDDMHITGIPGSPVFSTYFQSTFHRSVLKGCSLIQVGPWTYCCETLALRYFILVVMDFG